VILSDIGMPGEDGYDLIASVRSMEHQRGWEPVPAAALTAFAREEDRNRALTAGFHAHVTKPVEPNEVVATVATLAGRSANGNGSGDGDGDGDGQGGGNGQG
jgi:CheY-like chemotaxis protein